VAPASQLGSPGEADGQVLPKDSNGTAAFRRTLLYMEGGAAERDALLRRQIAVMSPDRFEQLVLALAQREYPDVRRLKHPDGGADTLRPATSERKAEVWQAKHYPDHINWQKCEDSLDTAIKRWGPSRLIFCFPRDLSQRVESSFESRLVQRKSAKDARVEVGLWNLSELVRRLDENDDIKRRFFGQEQESLLAGLERAIQTGGRLESGRDLVRRAETLGDFAEQQDPDFTYWITSSGPTTPEPRWDRLPYITMRVMGERSTVRVDAWVREGAEVELPAFSFRDDEEGQAARREAVKSLARGEEAVVTEGGQLRLSQAPELMREHLLEASEMEGTATLAVGPPLALELEIENRNGERMTRHVDIRPVPPPPGRRMAFAGYSGSVLVELTFELLDRPTIRANITLSAHFGSGARENAEAAELLHAFYGHTRVSLRNAELFPSGGLTDRFDQARDDEMLAQMSWRKDFYTDVAFIEDRLGIELPIPDGLVLEDLNAVATVAQVLRMGGGTATFHQAEGFVESPADIPRVPEELREQGTLRRDVTYPVFGQELNLGPGDYEIPPLKVVKIIPYGQTPTAPARVVVAPEDDDQAPFRLV
jgi:hypothetical protein